MSDATRLGEEMSSTLAFHEDEGHVAVIWSMLVPFSKVIGRFTEPLPLPSVIFGWKLCENTGLSLVMVTWQESEKTIAPFEVFKPQVIVQVWPVERDILKRMLCELSKKFPVLFKLPSEVVAVAKRLKLLIVGKAERVWSFLTSSKIVEGRAPFA